MIRFKKCVKLRGIRAEALMILVKGEKIYNERLHKNGKRGVDLVVTSALDGKHSRRSLHYVGLALDLRTRDFAKGEASIAAKFLQRRLGRQYDVVLERDHIHVEYDPKE